MTIERKLVIDTNLWISRMILPKGVAARAVTDALSWGVPLMSEETLKELVDAFSRSKFDKYASRERRSESLLEIRKIVQMINVTQRIAACRDPKDDKLIDVALNGGARLLLTGDKDLLALHPFRGVEILSPHDFLNNILASTPPDGRA